MNLDIVDLHGGSSSGTSSLASFGWCVLKGMLVPEFFQRSSDYNQKASERFDDDVVDDDDDDDDLMMMMMRRRRMMI